MGAGTDDAQLHVARIADMDPLVVHAIMRLRCDVFVVEQQCAYPEIDGLDAEPTTRHLWLSPPNDPRQVVSYLRILEPRSGPTMIGRIVSLPAHRKTGLGSQLVHTALAMLDDEMVRVCELNAQLYAAPWYEGFGFVTCGKVFVEDGISHVPMRRANPALPRAVDPDTETETETDSHDRIRVGSRTEADL